MNAYLTINLWDFSDVETLGNDKRPRGAASWATWGVALSGTWKVVSMEHDGKQPSAEQPKMTKWIVNGDRNAIVIRFESDKGVFFMSYKLDPTTEPKSLEIEAAHAPTMKGSACS